MKIGINCGHTVAGTTGSGAVGILNESDETRAVGYKLMEKLKALGHTVVDCTNDHASSVSENLRCICNIANSVNLDAFYSIHLNSGGGKGTECYTYNGVDKAKASQICEKMNSIGFVNRGVKDGSKLYVIKNTSAPACLIEVCFVDTQSDADLYKSLGADKIAQTICEAITGQNVNPSTPVVTPTEDNSDGEDYDALLKRVKTLEEKVNKYESQNKKYQTINEVPSWAKDTIQKLLNMGVLKGTGDGLDLDDNLIRMCVIMDRAGVFDNA